MDYDLNTREKKLLAMANNFGVITLEDTVSIYRTRHHAQRIIDRLEFLGLLVKKAKGNYILSDEGNEVLKH